MKLRDLTPSQFRVNLAWRLPFPFSGILNTNLRSRNSNNVHLVQADLNPTYSFLSFRKLAGTAVTTDKKFLYLKLCYFFSILLT